MAAQPTTPARDEYAAEIAADSDDDVDPQSAALLASLRPLSATTTGGKPPRPVSGKVAAARTVSPDATSDVAMGKPSSTTQQPRPGAVAEADAASPRGFPGSRPVSAKAPAPPRAPAHSASRPVSARHPGGGASTSMSGYGVMLSMPESGAMESTAPVATAVTSRGSVRFDQRTHSPRAHAGSVTRATSAAAASFAGTRAVPPSPTHQPTRPGSLAFKPSLSRLTQHVVDEAARCRFDTTVHVESNHDAVVAAHRELSLREPMPACSDPREFSVAGRVQKRTEAARQRRSELEMRLRANAPSFTQPGSREAMEREAAAEAGTAALVRSTVVSRCDGNGLPDPIAEAAMGEACEKLHAKLSRLRRELAFRTAYRVPRNDDLRLDQVGAAGLGNYKEPYVAPDKLFACRTSKAAVDAAVEDAAMAADAKRSPRDSRPPTPRSVGQFFNRGRSACDAGGSDGKPFDAPTFEEQDERYGEAMRAAVKAAIARSASKRGGVSPRTTRPPAGGRTEISVRPRPNTAAARAGRVDARSASRIADQNPQPSKPIPRRPSPRASPRGDTTFDRPTTVHEWVQQVAVATSGNTSTGAAR